MPSTTLKTKGVHGCQRLAAPISERQQLAILMQISSVEQLGAEGGSVSPRSPLGSNPSPRGRNRNERGETPLHVAAIKGDHNQVKKLLIERGADPNSTDFAGWTPLHEACNKGWYEVARVLLEAGASVNARGCDDITPLHDAALNGHAKLVRLLVSRGADVSQRNKWGRTPRDEAAPGLDMQLFQSDMSDHTLSSQVVSGDENQTSLVKYQYLPGNMDSKGSVEETKEEPSQTAETDKPTEKVTEDNKSPSGFDDGASGETGVKRSLQDVAETLEEAEEDAKKKKRRDSDATPTRMLLGKNSSIADKPAKTTPLLKNTISGQSAKVNSSSTSSDHNSPVLIKPIENEDENEEMPLAKCLMAGGEGGPKVPPLKIVIPQQSTTLEQEQGVRNGKNGKSHQALPYVVASSNSNDSVSDKEASANPSPTDCGGGTKSGEDKKEAHLTAEERSHPRVLRSSHRSGGSSSSSSSGSQPPVGAVINTSGGNNSNASSPQPGSGNSVGDRNSNNSSPHQSNSQGQSPSPDVIPTVPAEEPPTLNVPKPPSVCASPPAVEVKTEPVDPPTAPSISTPSVELHPRKRKLKQSKEAAPPPANSTSDLPEVASVVPEIHPHDQPITNCYQLFLDIRKQIERRRKGLFPVQPKPPQGFKDYLMNRCTYVLAGNASSRLSIPNVTPPQSLQGSMKDLFTEQEKERYRLRMQHVIEKEKLVLSVEQEILRVHGRAARALANQTRPFSVCTILKDEEVYNVITPEQEEKDRNARSRYNGRLFLSWLQDVDDKWEKIKESMCLRHHNEAESLHAVQKMDWEWKMKELGICEFKAKPVIEDIHVPMVHVSDDFDLLPA